MDAATTEPRPVSPGSSPCSHTFDLSADGREPIRAELFGPESMEAFIRELAACAVTSRSGSIPPLPTRFADNGRVLGDAVRRFQERTKRPPPLTAEAEWLLDNWYVLQEVLRDVRRDLPQGYYRQLPRVAEGPLAGYPRVYALALTLVAHTDSALDEEHLSRIVDTYQTVSPLTIGELWAVPIMLRLVF
jgi:cyclic beta-1,2-glucan synthetase